MVFLGGIYKFSPKNSGFRNDHCNHCKAQVMSERVTTYNVAHFFFVPLIPLGTAHKWRCCACKNDPLERTRESPALLITGTILFGLVGIIGLLSALFGAKDRMMMLCVGGGMFMAGLLCWFVLKLQQGEKDGTTEKIEPNRDTECPFCNGEIVESSTPSCVSCGARRF